MLTPKSIIFLFTFLFSSLSFAAQEGIPASGRTFSYVDATILMFGAALVFIMQAGFAFLEAGNTRAKNSVNVLLKNYLDVCLGAIGYWAVGLKQ